MTKTNNTVKLDKLQVALLNDENFLRRVAERFCQYLILLISSGVNNKEERFF